jgi:translation initiation factor 2 subunit 3
MDINQPNLNLGTLGSVSDGKSEMIFQLTGGHKYGGIRTQRDSREKKRNITIKAGYANIKLWKCESCNFKYSSSDSLLEFKCEECDQNCVLIKTISFADCPGHQELIETMLNSVSLMRGAIVIIAASEPIKQKPQLIQHLIAAKMANLEKLIICMNKCDLVPIDLVRERKAELDALLLKLKIKPCIIIPTSFTHRIGINELVNAIDYYFNDEVIENNNKSIFRITRSFDINQPIIDYSEIKGGCVGGSLMSGKFQIGDEVEINPGILTRTKDGRYTNEPIRTKLISFQSNKKDIEEVTPGGLVALLTDIDPFYCKNDSLKSNIVTHVGHSLPVYNELQLQVIKIDEFDERWEPKNGDKIFLQIANMSSEARIAKIKNDIMTFQLMKPICIEPDSKILICLKQGILKIVAMGFFSST